MLGDFNIHVCSSANALAKESLHVLSSSNVVQWVNGLTHCYGQTLDLILSYGLSVADAETGDIPVSDHRPVLCSAFRPDPEL